MSRPFNVVVLCPNGKRETIKVSPNSSILQVLEEACRKQNINPEDFDLRHFNKILDLSLPIRFSNLPNNAQLELRPAQNSRKDSTVTVCLQLESGDRLTEDFSPLSSIYDVLEHWLSSDIIINQDPACIYMRQKIAGDSLKTTTLRGLGLTNGKAVFRLVYQKPNELEYASISNSQNVTGIETQIKKESLEMHPQIKEEPVEITPAAMGSVGMESQMKKESIEVQQQIKEEPGEIHQETKDPARIQMQIKQETGRSLTEHHSNNLNIMVQEQNDNCVDIKSESIKVEDDIVKMEIDCNLNNLIKEESTLSQIHHPQETVRNEERKYDLYNDINMEKPDKRIKMECDLETPEDSFEGVGAIKYIGERHAVLYDLNDVSEVKKADLDDEFFNLTIDDAKYLLSEYKRQRDELENQPLLTKEQRQRKLLQKLAHYSQTVIRIFFPERLVLQAVFEALETVQDVSHFVRNYLEDKDLKFYLYVTPPKEKLNPSKTLLEAMLVPASVIYFGCDLHLPSYLMSNLRNQLSDPRAAALAASESRKSSISSVPVDVPNQYANVTTVEDNVVETTFSAPSTSQSSHKSEKVPKWLKLSRK